jgi:hypothetical protein
MVDEIHTIRTAGNKEVPSGTCIELYLTTFPGTIGVRLGLPGQKKFSNLGAVSIVNGVVTLPVKLLFFSYAREDQRKVTRVANRLYQDGFLTWLDRKDIRPGDTWKTRIKRGMESADYILIFLSQASCKKTGYVQVEMKDAFEMSKRKPDGQRFIIPILLESCTPPDRFADTAWLHWWEDGAYERLKAAFAD